MIKASYPNWVLDPDKTYFVIWTTTTWTLPANLAICLGPEFDYSVVKCDGEYYIMATALYEKAMEAAGKTEYEVVASLKGAEMEYMKAKHPFIDRESLVIVGDHVTLESGTGCVHTAPGHGVDDYNVCKNNYPELPIVVPVDNHGKMTRRQENNLQVFLRMRQAVQLASIWKRLVQCLLQRESFTNIRTAGVVKIRCYSVQQSNGSVL